MKKLFLIGLIVLAILTACQNKTAKDDSVNANEEIVLNDANTVMVNMDIEGMTCGGCETTIQDGVSALNGIAEVKASYVDGKAYVKVDTSISSLEDVSSAIESKGYHVKTSMIVVEQTMEEPAEGTSVSGVNE
jgi:copper chaperone CopZ